MKLANHCWNSKNSDLASDIEVTARTGYQALELGAWKIDDFLADHSLDDLRKLLDEHQIAPTTINSIEFIAFRGDEYQGIQDRCRANCAGQYSPACAAYVPAKCEPTCQTNYRGFQEDAPTQ